MNRQSRSVALLTVALFTLAACASAPRISMVQDPDAEFPRYATYTFSHPLGTDRESDVSTVLGKELSSLARTEMESRGYTYVEQGADLEVDFEVATKEQIESVPAPGWGAHYGYWNYPYGVWADYDQERIRQFTEGALHLDIIDVARKQLIWEAMAEHRVKSEHAYADADVRAAMTGMFAGFPRRTAPAK